MTSASGGCRSPVTELGLQIAQRCAILCMWILCKSAAGPGGCIAVVCESPLLHCVFLLSVEMRRWTMSESRELAAIHEDAVFY